MHMLRYGSRSVDADMARPVYRKTLTSPHAQFTRL